MKTLLATIHIAVGTFQWPQFNHRLCFISPDTDNIHYQSVLRSRSRKLIKERRGILPRTMSADLILAAARASDLVASFMKK